jgi:putative flippase GtrA
MGVPALFQRLKDRLERAWRERALSLKAASFAMIGVVNTLIDLAVFLVAYSVLALPLVPANVLAWLVAVSCSYVMNCFITFAAESGRQLRLRDYGTFVASGIAGVVTNTTVLVIAAYWMPVLAAKLLAILASFLVNFSLSHFVVFRQRAARVETSPNESQRAP